MPKKKKTTEAFKKEYSEKFPKSKISIIGEYTGSKYGIECQCICGYKWKPRASHILEGSSCPKCAGTLQKTTSSFIAEYYEKYPDTNIEIIGEYVNSNTHIECKCKICSYEWSTTPSNLLKGHGCPNCSKCLKKDTSSFRKEYYEKFPDSNIDIIGEYITAKKPIKVRCRTCNWEWEPVVKNLGSGCPYCSKRPKYNTETFKKNYQQKFPESTIEIIGKYISSNMPITLKCKNCNYEWEVIAGNISEKTKCPSCKNKAKMLPRSLLQGGGCKKCASKTRLKTTEQFREEYYKKFPDSEISIIGEYIDLKSDIKCKCGVCGHQWNACVRNLKQFGRCPECSRKKATLSRTKTHEQFMKEYDEKYPDSKIEIISKYINGSTPIEYRCKDCGYVHKKKPTHLLRNNACVKCNGTLRYTKETFIEKLNKLYPDNNIIIKGKFVNTNHRLEVECAYCHKIWEPQAVNLLRGKFCPYCSTSKGEKSIGLFLDSVGILYTPQKKFDDCKRKSQLPFDFEINDKRFTTFLLEYQGEQHERPIDFAGKGSEWAEEHLKDRKTNDKIKYDFCKNTNRSLEYIWYYEEDKIQALINLLRKYIKPEYDLDEIISKAKTTKTA